MTARGVLGMFVAGLVGYWFGFDVLVLLLLVLGCWLLGVNSVDLGCRCFTISLRAILCLIAVCLCI